MVGTSSGVIQESAYRSHSCAILSIIARTDRMKTNVVSGMKININSKSVSALHVEQME